MAIYYADSRYQIKVAKSRKIIELNFSYIRNSACSRFVAFSRGQKFAV